MGSKKSAGLVIFRGSGRQFQVLLVHPGGPFWKNKEDGVWTIPKGEYEDGEDPQQAAIRECEEETGLKVQGKFYPLQPVKLKSGKRVVSWAIDYPVAADHEFLSNEFQLEWPPHSGKIANFPEVDRWEWFDVATAIIKINPALAPLIIETEQLSGKIQES